MTPSQVTAENESQIWQRMYGPGGAKLTARDKKPDDIKTDDMVRISKVKRTFEKGYTPNWTTEHFYVDEQVTNPKRMYKLRDYQGEKIKGNFYPEEIQKITKIEYLIEKILARRKSKDGSKEVRVKWLGFPSKYNSWVPEDTLKSIEDSK
jgi:hypothetical protein